MSDDKLSSEDKWMVGVMCSPVLIIPIYYVSHWVLAMFGIAP